MGLSEPVSGSHVASATDSASHYILSPPYCSPSSSISVLLSSSQANPSSIPPPPLSSVPAPDPAPPASSAAVGGPDPPPASRSTSTGNPRSSLLHPPNPDSSPVPAPSDGSGPVLVADLAPTNCHGSVPAPLPCSSSNLSSFPSLFSTVNPINPKSAALYPHSSSKGPDPPPSVSDATVPPSVHYRILPHSLHSPSVPSSSPLLANPPSSFPPKASLKPSYAQAARSGRGSGFVRSHADAVDHFARVPRTGAKIICGSREGVPSFSFVPSDLPMVEEIYSNALVMKFSGGRPSLEASQKEIISWGMEQSFSIGPLSSRAFLLRFQDERDLLKVLTRPSAILITFPYKIFRWHRLCHLSEDSSMAPVWISLPRLPMQCFIPEFLETVGNKLGRFLCFDRATTTLARPSVARICVELDLSKPLPQFIWVGLFEGFKQSIIYERLPKFCNHCHRLGHATAVCSQPCTVLEAHVDGGRPAMPEDCPPPVRANAERIDRSQSSAVSPSKVPPPPPANSSQSEEQPPPVQVPPTRRQRAHQRQSDPSSLSSTTLKFASPESSQGSHLKSAVPTSPLPVASAQVQPSNQAELQPIPPTKSKSKNRNLNPKKKSVSFKVPGQSNLSANVKFWNAVNNQVSIIAQNPTNISSQVAIVEQVRLNKSSDVPSISLAPTSTHVEDCPPPPINQMFYQDNCSSDESSGSSLAADSPPISPCGLSTRLRHNSIGHKKPTYASDGEAQPTEPSSFRGHSTDDLIDKLPLHSRRNKRHPNQPLNVQLRVRKDPNSTLL